LRDQRAHGLAEAVGGAFGVSAEAHEGGGAERVGGEISGDGGGLGVPPVVDESEELGVEGLVGGVGDGAEGDEGDSAAPGPGANGGGFHVDGGGEGLGEEGGFLGDGGDEVGGGVDLAAEDAGGCGDLGGAVVEDDVADLEGGIQGAGEAGHDDPGGLILICEGFEGAGADSDEMVDDFDDVTGARGGVSGGGQGHCEGGGDGPRLDHDGCKYCHGRRFHRRVTSLTAPLPRPHPPTGMETGRVSFQRLDAPVSIVQGVGKREKWRYARGFRRRVAYFREAN